MVLTEEQAKRKSSFTEGSFIKTRAEGQLPLSGYGKGRYALVRITVNMVRRPSDVLRRCPPPVPSQKLEGNMPSLRLSCKSFGGHLPSRKACFNTRDQAAGAHDANLASCCRHCRILAQAVIEVVKGNRMRH